MSSFCPPVGGLIEKGMSLQATARLLGGGSKREGNLAKVSRPVLG